MIIKKKICTCSKYFSSCKGIEREKSAAGFSLIELMVVLLLLSLLVGVVAPATGRFLDNLAFRKQTSSFLSGLRYARLTAISKGREVEVSLDEIDGTILSFTGAVIEEIEFDLDEDASFTLDPSTITFYPEGYVTPASLSSEKGSRVQNFILDPLTALPIAEEISE